ncbi:WD40-repeat-containing domain protein [Suillus bovinus]|uniref:WD40-repeat-containing domain protein n=1 Tax=Suillus bovinus TaxID=48563 RepID=UPI001B85FC87|nr:WD40-repeat-containing domain protein [Suillus bovinus]KAG2151597.1 WD40-repeat-containing domain protein [Suillus bovinus]
MYSPDSSKLATGGYKENAVHIWDAETGERLNTLEHSRVFGLAWTSDGSKLISGSHQQCSRRISLSRNNRLLASASLDNTARLWNLDTNLPVEVTFQRKWALRFAALSPDGNMLVTACENKNAYVWDVHAILKRAGLQHLLPSSTNIVPKDSLEEKASQDDLRIEHTPRWQVIFGIWRYRRALADVFFAGMETDAHSSPVGGAHLHSSANAFLARLSSLLHSFQPENGEATELPQTSRPSAFHPHALLARLSSHLHHFRPENNAPDELQQLSTPSQLDPHVLLARLSSFLPRPRLGTDEEAEPHPTSFSSRPDALFSRLYSLFRSQPHTNEEIELPQHPSCPHAVEVTAVRDKQDMHDFFISASSDSALTPFLVVILVQCIDLDNANCSKRRTV